MIEFKDLTVTCPGGSLVSFSQKLANGSTYGVWEDRTDGTSLLLSLLSGVISPDMGEVRINGFSMRRDTARAKRCVGSLPRAEMLPEELTVIELLTFVADAYGMNYEKALRRISTLLDEWELSAKRTRTVGKLTPSEQRILCTLTLLLPDPEFYLLDFPGVLSERERHDIALFFESIPQGRTVFLATGDPALLKAHCEQVLLFENGNLSAMLPPDDVRITSQKPQEEPKNASAPIKKSIGSILTEKTKEEILDGEENV